MEHVGRVPWNKEALNSVVLKSNKKETIKALVTVHLKTVQNVDVVENKGNGLIVLLHGSPGTGRCFFARSCAFAGMWFGVQPRLQ
jgi:ATP-dependent 26S proteasome regulatory subunit